MFIKIVIFMFLWQYIQSICHNVQEVFTFSEPHKDKKQISQHKIIISNVNEEECHSNCILMIDCKSYDYHTYMKVCEVNFNDGSKLTNQTGWKHIKKVSV